MVKVKNQPRKAPQNDDLPSQGAVTYPQPPSSARDAGLPSTIHTSHHDTHADAHMQYVREQLLDRIRCAFAEQAALFDSEANELQPSPTAQIMPDAPANSLGGSPAPTTAVQGTLEPTGCSQPHTVPAIDDASLYDGLPPLIDDAPSSVPLPVRAPRTSLGDGVCMDTPSAPSDAELDILAPSPLPPARPAGLLNDSWHLDHKDSNKVADALDSTPPLAAEALTLRRDSAAGSGPQAQGTTPEPSVAAPIPPRAVWRQLMQHQAQLAADAAASVAAELHQEVMFLRERLNEEIRSRRSVEQQLHDAHSACTSLRGQLRTAHQAAEAAGALGPRRAPQVPVSKLRLQADELQRRLVQGVAMLEQDADMLAAQVDAAQQATRGGASGHDDGEEVKASALAANTAAADTAAGQSASAADDAPSTHTSVADALADVRATLRALVRGGRGIDQLVQHTAMEVAALGDDHTAAVQDLAARAQLELNASRAANQALAVHVEQIEGDIAAMCGLAPSSCGSPPGGAYTIQPESVMQGPGGVWIVRPPLAPRAGRGRGRAPAAGQRRPPGNHRRPKIISIGGDGHARVGLVPWRGEGYGRRSEEDEEEDEGLHRARRRQRVDYRLLDGGAENA